MSDSADGKIIIETELSSEGFKKGSDKLEKAVNSLSSKMNSLGPSFEKGVRSSVGAVQKFESKTKSLESAISDVEAKIKQLGNSKISTEDYEWLTKEIKKAENELMKLEEKQIKFEELDVSKSSKSWKNLQYDIDLARRKLADYKAEQAYMRENGTAFTSGTDTPEYASLQAELEQLRNKLSELQSGTLQAKTGITGFLLAIKNAAPLSEQFKQSLLNIKQAFLGIPQTAGQIKDSLKNVGASIKNAFNHPIKSINQALGSARAGIKQLAKEATKHIGSGIKNAFKNAVKHIGAFKKSMNGASRSTNKFGGTLNNIKNLLTNMLVFKAFQQIMNGAKDGLNNLAKYSSKTNKDLSALKSALTQLKNSFATAFAPILSVVTPILTNFINHISTAVTYVGKLIAALTGKKTFTKATAVQEDYAASLDKTSDSAKEAKSQLMGFDKINKLDDDSSSGADVSGMFEEVAIDSEITDFAQKIRTAIENSDYEGIGELLAEKLNGIVDKINQAIKWENVGPQVTAFVDGFTRTFNSLVENVDWSLIGNTIGEGVNTIVNTVYLLVTGIDWKNIGKAFSDGMNGFISTVDWAKIGETISTSVSSAFDIISSAIQNIDWQNLARETTRFIKGISWDDMSSALFETLGSALGGLSAYIGTIMSDAWKNFTDYWDSYIDWDDAPSDIIAGLLEGIKNAMSNIKTWRLNNVWVPFKDGFKEAFGIHSLSTKMIELAGYIVEGIKVGIGDIWSKVKQKFTDFIDNIKQWFTSKKEDIEEVWANFTSGIKDIKATITAKVEEAKDSVREKITETWTNIKTKAATLTATVKDHANSLRSKVETSWSNIKTKTQTLTANVKDHADSIRTKIATSWSNIKTKTATLTAKAVESGKTKLSTIKDYWKSISSKTANLSMTVTDKVTSFVSKVVNSIVNTLNKFIRAINKLPGVNVSEIPVQKFAKGGIVDSATLSLVGEAGKEAVIPLERNTGWMRVMAKAIADEIARDDFSVQKVQISYSFDETLVDGIKQVSYGFLDKLQAIASGVTFAMPVTAQQIVPYAVSANVESDSNIGTIIENSNDELAITITRAIATAALNIVGAIEKQNVNVPAVDSTNMTNKVIEEINRIKRITGKSPINS